MGVGIAMLAHEHLDRAAAVAGHLAKQGAAVSVHLDRAVGAAAIAEFRGVGAVGDADLSITSQHHAEWGRFSMIEATFAAVSPLLAREDLSHICLISGACLPIRPFAELADYLADHPEKDFIESVPALQDRWVQDGLVEERLTLFHPFSHRHQPGLFSLSVEVQRRLGVRRKLPQGLQPHLGSQWWCLSVNTLRAILHHPEGARWRQFFRHSWIPDESYFQMLVRVVRPDAEPAPPLHVGGFNARGRPHVFHDDHLDLLKSAEGYFARKIDPDAHALYQHFLAPGLVSEPRLHCRVTTAFHAAKEERATQGAGLLTPARMPAEARITVADTAGPYAVLLARDHDTLRQLKPWLRGLANTPPHGRLFKAGAPAEFAVPGPEYIGNLPADPVLRDYRPAQFLSRVVWADAPQRTSFWLTPEDEAQIRVHLVNDPNARLIFVGIDPAKRLATLCAPFDEPSGPSLPLHCWHRQTDPRPEAIREVLVSDWNDPRGWAVPT